MRVISMGRVEIQSEKKDGESFTLEVYPSNTILDVGFQIVFPKDCEVIRFSDNSVIIRCKRPVSEE